jgi:conjugal transfer/entry exclusion protein
MFKFLFRLAIVVVAVYFLMQIPFFAKYGQDLKASVLGKVQNVTNEVDRVKGKINGVEQTISNTQKKVNDVTQKVEETGKTLEGAINTLNSTTDALKNVLNTSSGTPKGLGVAQPTTSTPSTPSAATK